MRKRFYVDSSKSTKNTSLGRNPQKRQSMAQKGSPDTTIHFDIVCGEKVKDTPFQHHYQAHTYYFCSEACKEKFVDAPKKYLGEFKKEIFTKKY